MTRLSSVFAQSNHKVLIPYLTVGYPSLEATLEIVPQLAAWGCDMVELGIPFSDPLADGTTIQASSFRALQSGVSPKICLKIASQLREKVDSPLIFMTYYNPVFNFGLEPFCKASAEAGVDGFIIPDLPPEEGGELEAITQKYNLDLIYLLAPTSGEERIDIVAKRSHGFIYLVSLTGVTGPRETLPPELEGFIHKVRQKASQPLCVGFGISTPEQARRIAKIADGVIIGSRIIQLLGDRTALQDFIGGLRDALDRF